MNRSDVVIVGGGIVGVATAYQLTQRLPDVSVTLLEKEDRLAAHQTGRNSGVLHSGIYYRPDSLRAKNCRTGKEALQEFCREHGVPFDLCGKVIVAVDESELSRLDTIYERGQANGVRCEKIGPERLHEIEPHVAGVRAIHVPEAGIVDFAAACEAMASVVRERGGRIVLGAKLESVRSDSESVVASTTSGDYEARYLITCCGLHADRVTKLTGMTPDAQIVPFRGEYYTLAPHAEKLCRGLIYPVPDPRFPFLGVHFTRMIEGGVECGPNAVLALAREGYTKGTVNFRDLVEELTYPGLCKLALKYWRTGIDEIHRSYSKSAFVKALQRLVPEVQAADLTSAPAGVRAQALGRHGEIIDDFQFQESERIINVVNAPSPAATSALNIGRLVIEKLADRLHTAVAHASE